MGSDDSYPIGAQTPFRAPAFKAWGRGDLKTYGSPGGSSEENEALPQGLGSSEWAALFLASWNVAQRRDRFRMGFGGH